MSVFTIEIEKSQTHKLQPSAYMSTNGLPSRDLLVSGIGITNLQPQSVTAVQDLRRSRCLQPAAQRHPSVRSGPALSIINPAKARPRRHQWCFPAHAGTASDKIHSLMKPVIKCASACVCVFDFLCADDLHIHPH